jgi:hypothetical protein
LSKTALVQLSRISHGQLEILVEGVPAGYARFDCSHILGQDDPTIITRFASEFSAVKAVEGLLCVWQVGILKVWNLTASRPLEAEPPGTRTQLAHVVYAMTVLRNHWLLLPFGRPYSNCSVQQLAEQDVELMS